MNNLFPNKVENLVFGGQGLMFSFVKEFYFSFRGL